MNICNQRIEVTSAVKFCSDILQIFGLPDPLNGNSDKIGSGIQNPDYLAYCTIGVFCVCISHRLQPDRIHSTQGNHPDFNNGSVLPFES